MLQRWGSPCTLPSSPRPRAHTSHSPDLTPALTAGPWTPGHSPSDQTAVITLTAVLHTDLGRSISVPSKLLMSCCIKLKQLGLENEPSRLRPLLVSPIAFFPLLLASSFGYHSTVCWCFFPHPTPSAPVWVYLSIPLIFLALPAVSSDPLHSPPPHPPRKRQLMF